MKRITKIFGSAMLLAFSCSANAQMNDGTTRTATFGVKGGVNFATIAGDDFDSPDSRTSFHVGVLGEFPVAEIFSIQVEALYSGQGFESDINGGIFGGDGKVEYQLDYINVPVLAKLYATRNLSFEVGPQFSFKVNEEIDADPSGDGGDLPIDEAKDFEVGIAGGLTFQTDMGLFATGRYIYGLTEIIENNDARNSVFQIGIGYKF